MALGFVDLGVKSTSILFCGVKVHFEIGGNTPVLGSLDDSRIKTRNMRMCGVVEAMPACHWVPFHAGAALAWLSSTWSETEDLLSPKQVVTAGPSATVQYAGADWRSVCASCAASLSFLTTASACGWGVRWWRVLKSDLSCHSLTL